MAKKGSDNGIILCTASNAGLYPVPIAPTYSIAKHGLVGGVRSLAQPLAEDGIRINAICPNCIGISFLFFPLFPILFTQLVIYSILG